jgi:hypothetical protein
LFRNRDKRNFSPRPWKKNYKLRRMDVSEQMVRARQLKEMWQEVLTVRLKDGSRIVDASDVRAWLRERLIQLDPSADTQ